MVWKQCRSATEGGTLLWQKNKWTLTGKHITCCSLIRRSVFWLFSLDISSCNCSKIKTKSYFYPWYSWIMSKMLGAWLFYSCELPLPLPCFRSVLFAMMSLPFSATMRRNMYVLLDSDRKRNKINFLRTKFRKKIQHRITFCRLNSWNEMFPFKTSDKSLNCSSSLLLYRAVKPPCMNLLFKRFGICSITEKQRFHSLATIM